MRNFSPDMFTRDAMQASLAFMLSQATFIENEVYATQYPDIQYPSLVPVDTSAPDWVKSITYFSTDMEGKADWFHAKGHDIAIADVSRTKNEVGVEMANIGYRFDIEEVNEAMRYGRNLTVERGQAAYRAYEEFVDVAVMFGKPEKNFNGLINYPGVPIVQAAGSGSGGLGPTNWVSKTGDEIMADINTLLSGGYMETLTVELADTLLLPVDMAVMLGNKRLGDTESTVWRFLAQNNVYTNITGRPLTIRGVRGLETAGVGGSGRMVAYRRDPQVVKVHIPMSHRFLPVWQTGPMVFDVPGIFRFAGVEVRRPKAFRYMDDISNAAAS